MKPSFLEGMSHCNHLTLSPGITAGIQIRDEETGKSDSHQIRLSTKVSLSDAMIAAGVTLAAAHLLFFLCRMRREYRIRKKYREKISRLKEKMSKP